MGAVRSWWVSPKKLITPGGVEKRTATKRNELNHLPVVKKGGSSQTAPPVYEDTSLFCFAVSAASSVMVFVKQTS